MHAYVEARDSAAVGMLSQRPTHPAGEHNKQLHALHVTSTYVHTHTTACSACCCSGEVSSVAVLTKKSSKLLLPKASSASLDSGSSAFFASQRAAVAFSEASAEPVRDWLLLPCCCCEAVAGLHKDASCCFKRPRAPSVACCSQHRKWGMLVRSGCAYEAAVVRLWHSDATVARSSSRVEKHQQLECMHCCKQQLQLLTGQLLRRRGLNKQCHSPPY
jgi:hypothetical protein